jgi:hypothetical protein
MHAPPRKMPLSALDLRQRLLLLLGVGRNLNPCVEQTGAVPFQ